MGIRNIVDTNIPLGYRKRVANIYNRLECQIKKVAAIARNKP